MTPLSTTAVTMPRSRWLLSLGLLLAMVLRVVAIDRPLVGHYATKNVVYGMIARNWATGEASLWRPTVDVLVDGQRGWHLLEFPVSAYLAGALWQVFGGELDLWGRAVSAVFSLASIVLMYWLARRWYGETAAVGAAAVLAFSPVSIIFGQSFMLESSVVCFTLATMLSLDKWLASRRTRWLAVASGCFALLLLTKIYMLVLLVPLVAQAIVAHRTSANLDRRQYWLLVGATLLAILPAAVWYADAWRVAAPGSVTAERVFYSVRDSAESHRWPHPLLTSAEFYRRLLDNLAGLWLTPVALGLAIIGLLHPAWRRQSAWLAAMLLLVVLLPRKFHELSYYGLVILPPLCLLAGLGWQVAVERLRPSRLAIAACVIMGLAFSLRYAAGPGYSTPAEDRAVLTAAAAFRDVADSDTPVLTMHGTAPDLLYYCARPGWCVAPDDKDLAAKIADGQQHGARWLVVANSAAAAEHLPTATLLQGFTKVREGEGFCVYRLPAVERRPELITSGIPTAPGTK